MFDTCNLTLRLAEADNLRLSQIRGDQAVCVQDFGKLAVSHSAKTGIYTVKHGKALHKCTGTQSLLECVGGKTGYQSIPHIKRTNFPGCDYTVSTVEALKNARIQDFPENATVCVMDNNDILSVTRKMHAKGKAAMTVQHRSGKTGAVNATMHQVCHLAGKLHPQFCKPMYRAPSQRIMKNRYANDKRALFGPEVADGGTESIDGGSAPRDPGAADGGSAPGDTGAAEGPPAYGPGSLGAAAKYEAQMREAGLYGATGNNDLAWNASSRLAQYQGVRDGTWGVTQSMIEATMASPGQQDSMIETMNNINRGRSQTAAEVLAEQLQRGGDTRSIEEIAAESGLPHNIPDPYSEEELEQMRLGLGRTVDSYTQPESIEVPETERIEDVSGLGW